ncbi:MAG: TolC family protein [Prevotella sp.]
MNKTRVWVCSIVCLLAIQGASAQQKEAWSLKDCLEYALANNLSIRKSANQIAISKENLKQSKAALLPSLSASTNQSIGYRPWMNGNTSTVTNGQVTSGVQKKYYNGSYGVSGNWTVWNGNKNRNTVKLNKLYEQEAELDSAVNAKSIQEQIMQLYVQLLYLKEAIEVNRSSAANSKANEERGKVMMEVGKLSRVDVAQLAAQTAQDQYNLVEAQTNFEKYRLQLKQILELPDSIPFEVQVPLTEDNEALQTLPVLQDIYSAALALRPEIKKAGNGISEQELNVKIAKAGYYPTLSLTAGASTNTSSRDDLAWQRQMKTNFDVQAGLTVSIPIYDQRQTKTATNKAKYEWMNSKLDLEQSKKDLYNTIENYWLDAVSNQQLFKSSIANVDSKQESYDLLEQQFQLGLKNIIELTTGKVNLLQAQQSKLQSKYLTILNMEMLQFYAQ